MRHLKRVITAWALVVGLLTPTAVLSASPAVAAPKSCSAGRIALTFDDGPAGATTRTLLRHLSDHRVPATFFMVGQRVAADPATARLVERSGHLVANHSWAHEDLRTRTAEQVRRSLNDTRAALRDAGTHPTPLMRPPYGATDAEALRGIRSAGLIPVLWDIDTRDWERRSTKQITDAVLGRLVRGRDHIVLQHDGVGNSPASVAAVPGIVRGARRAGYCFVALDEKGRPGFPTPRLSGSVVSTSVPEGAAIRIRLTLDRPAARAVSAQVRLTPGTAGRRDLGVIPRRITVPAGRMSGTVRIPVLRDRLDERREWVTISLTQPRGGTLQTSPIRVRLIDRDAPPPLRVRNARVAEPTTGSTVVRVPIVMARRSAVPVTVVARTVPGSADATDFTPITRRITLRPGKRVAHLPVVVTADALDESVETFTVRIRPVRNARVVRKVATVRITRPVEAAP